MCTIHMAFSSCLGDKFLLQLLTNPELTHNICFSSPSPGKKYCYGSTQGEYCHCDYCKCKHGYGSKGRLESLFCSEAAPDLALLTSVTSLPIMQDMVTVTDKQEPQQPSPEVLEEEDQSGLPFPLPFHIQISPLPFLPLTYYVCYHYSNYQPT